jgi:hypothetical protein
MHEANTHVGPAIGLPELPVIEFSPDDLNRGGSWKWAAVAEYADGRPLAWLDDDHSSPLFRGGRETFDEARAGMPTLLCHVDPAHGLSPTVWTSSLAIRPRSGVCSR